MGEKMSYEIDLSKLESILCNVGQCNHIPDDLIIRNKEKIVEEVSLFREHLSKVSNKFNTISGGQYYTRNFYFDNEFSNGFTIIWDVDKAKEITKKYSVSKVKVPIKQFINLIDREELDPGILNSPKDNNDPIILMLYDPLNQIIPLDGNHRIYKAFLKDSEAQLEAYLLNPYQHMEAILCDLFRSFYKFHHNVNVINNYLTGRIDKIGRFSKIKFIKEKQEFQRNLFRY